LHFAFLHPFFKPFLHGMTNPIANCRPMTPFSLIAMAVLGGIFIGHRTKSRVAVSGRSFCRCLADRISDIRDKKCAEAEFSTLFRLSDFVNRRENATFAPAHQGGGQQVSPRP
jgi:hypothetical protein